MTIVSESVRELAGSRAIGIHNLLPSDHRSQRCISAPEGLAARNEVWLNIPMLNGEGHTGSRKSGQYFIRNEQDIVSITDLTYPGVVSATGVTPVIEVPLIGSARNAATFSAPS